MNVLAGDGSGDDLRVQPDQWRPDRGHSGRRGGTAIHPSSGHHAEPDGRPLPAPTPHAGQGPQGNFLFSPRCFSHLQHSGHDFEKVVQRTLIL